MIPCNWKRSTVALLVLASLVFLLPNRSQACGPFFTDAIFVFEKHPDFPLDRFARGEVGVLLPTYARSYLVVAYRGLSGVKLSDAEVKAIGSLWDDRINLNYDERYEDWLKSWKDARAKVTGASAPPDIQVYRNREKPHEYEAYLNCQQDAFENAIATLNDRVKHYGNDSAEAREWLKAQDVVFSNCGGGSQIPEATAGQDQLARADRVYQIAAANFYAANFDEAAKQFDAIAHDASSPWREVAAYVAARAFLRKGSLADKEEQGRPAMAEAENRLNAILRDKSMSRTHHAAARLLALTRLRLHPEEKLQELAQSIVKRDGSADFKQDVWDYTLLLDKFVGDSEEVKTASVPDEVRADDVTDWILTFQDQSEAATNHAIEQWRKKKSTAWLVNAISKATAKTANLDSLLGAAASVDQSSTGYASLIFHRARLLMQSNRSAEARALLDRALAKKKTGLPPSAINLLTGERMELATNLGEFLSTAQRSPAGFSDNSDGREIPENEKEVQSTTNGARLFFDFDAASSFNMSMPVSVIEAAARDKALAANLHRDVAQAAFMRAALLDSEATADAAAATLGEAYPETKDLLTAYRRSTTPDARQFAAAYLALKFPGLRPYVTAGVGRSTAVSEIDEYRDNWWCAEPPANFGGYYSVTESDESTPKKRATVPEFLKASQREAGKELTALQSLGTGPNYLCKTVIDWATKSPNDSRVPEALHLAVKSTRYGCTDKETGRWSKAAFDLLHRKYPNSTWAKQTKYWFKG